MSPTVTAQGVCVTFVFRTRFIDSSRRNSLLVVPESQGGSGFAGQRKLLPIAQSEVEGDTACIAERCSLLRCFDLIGELGPLVRTYVSYIIIWSSVGRRQLLIAVRFIRAEADRER